VKIDVLYIQIVLVLDFFPCIFNKMSHSANLFNNIQANRPTLLHDVSAESTVIWFMISCPGSHLSGVSVVRDPGSHLSGVSLVWSPRSHFSGVSLSVADSGENYFPFPPSFLAPVASIFPGSSGANLPCHFHSEKRCNCTW
jgi:hypothetical protein